MSLQAHIALNRLGLGARFDDAAPADGRTHVLAQLDRYEALPAACRSVPRTETALGAFWAEQEALRGARGPADREAVKQRLRREARKDWIDGIGARLEAALQTTTPFLERMVHFWANHFAVSTDKVSLLRWASPFELDAVRPHVMGRFHDMLLASSRHPAMLLYLDQVSSAGPESAGAMQANAQGRRRGLNENLAREILELHTLGVRSGYTQEDVTEFARALTGWSVPDVRASERGQRTPFLFRAGIHEPGTRTLLGRKYPQAGASQAEAVLQDLAVAPATARHIATKLARHFVADDPPQTLVLRLEAAFLESGGDLPAVYRELVAAPQTWQEQPRKFKAPWDWLVSGYRALGQRAGSSANAHQLLVHLGQPVWRPGSPAGWDDRSASWAAPDALLRRVEVAQRLADQAGNAADARSLGPRVLPGTWSESTARVVARADSPAAATTLLLVSPEFLRR